MKENDMNNDSAQPDYFYLDPTTGERRTEGKSLMVAYALQTPFGEITLPLMVATAIKGGAPLDAVFQLWDVLVPEEALPNPLLSAMAVTMIKSLIESEEAQAPIPGLRPQDLN